MEKIKSDYFSDFNGLILVNKPAGMSSYDVIRKLKKMFFFNKIGHTGTLDPFAEGLMILTVNKATKISEFFLNKEKEYYGEIKLGITTDTLDITGTIIKEEDPPEVSSIHLASVVKSFEGKYIQKIPAYSAKKKDGQPLYKYARKGLDVPQFTNEVYIYKARLLKRQKDYFAINIKCSSGTYVRAVAADICKKLETLGTLSKLTRLKVGSFSIKDSIEPYKIISMAEEQNDKIIDKNEIKKNSWLCDIRSINLKLKAIKVKNDYLNQISKGFPLFNYMIDFGKTVKNDYKEKELITLKFFKEERMFLHRALKDFKIDDLKCQNELKLTKSILEI